jgi:hypothetical protein
MLITRADGLIDRDQAAELCGVSPDAVTLWATRGYIASLPDGGKERRFLPVALREGRSPLYDPVEVAKAERATRKRGRRPPPRPLLAPASPAGIAASGIDPRQLRGRAA